MKLLKKQAYQSQVYVMLVEAVMVAQDIYIKTMNGIMSRGYTKFGEHVEKSFQSVDINSRKELEDIAEEEKLDINFNNWWDRWNELVKQTKQDIKEELKGFEKINTNPVFVYDIRKQRVIKTFKSPKECAKYYNISRELVNTYIRDHRVYYKQGVEFRQ